MCLQNANYKIMERDSHTMGLDYFIGHVEIIFRIRSCVNVAKKYKLTSEEYPLVRAFRSW